MIATLLICILAIIILLAVMAYVGWPVILAIVAGIATYKFVRWLLDRRSV